mmetsp:Transcript_31416/g.57729  ORF Transcript_31416/g.57729 Transcript_31416/m.57729 type:complete len:603 (-) Transcript_31416:28-1836(-)
MVNEHHPAQRVSLMLQLEKETMWQDRFPNSWGQVGSFDAYNENYVDPMGYNFGPPPPQPPGGPYGAYNENYVDPLGYDMAFAGHGYPHDAYGAAGENGFEEPDGQYGRRNPQAPVLELAPALAIDERTGGPRGDDRHMAMGMASGQDRRGRLGHQQRSLPSGPRGQHQLRQLLDFYFEPFNLQHNRYILDVLARKVKQRTPPRGPWSLDQVAEFTFHLDDMMGLGRIATAMSRIRTRDLYSALKFEELRYLNFAEQRGFRLKEPCEARRFVHHKEAPEEQTTEAVQYLCAVREDKGKPPNRMVSVLSYSLADMSSWNASTPAGQQRRSRLRRQLYLHLTDFICLQGLDAGSIEMVQSLTYEETSCNVKYSMALAPGNDGPCTCAIVWDQHRWEKVQQIDMGDSLAIDFRTHGPERLQIRVVSMSPNMNRMIAGDYTELVPPRKVATDMDLPLLVCSDLAQIGGAECSGLLSELAELDSSMRDVLGEEVLGYCAENDPEIGETIPIRTGASELFKLHSPDAVHYLGLVALAALSGHTEPYLATLSQEEVPRQFPAFRLPLLAAFTIRAQLPSAGDMEAWPALPTPTRKGGSGKKEIPVELRLQ